MIIIFYIAAIFLPNQEQRGLHSKIAILFPATLETAPNITQLKLTAHKLKAVKIDGFLAYYISTGPLHLIATIKFDSLKPGLTLKELIAKLGPGYQSPLEGVGLIYWKCEDGRILKVMPDSYKLNEKPRYWIEIFGNNQKHAEVQKLAMDFIKGIQVKNEEVLIALTKDTPLAKAHEVRAYEVGDCFQKVAPLPRIDFRIRKMDGQAIHCEYFYQAEPKGLNHVYDTGWVIIQEEKIQEID